MTNTNQFSKDPDDVLDFELDWSDWLATSETISTSTWTVPTGIIKDTDTNTTTTTTIWLSGGTHGAAYQITNRAVTNQGRTKDQSIYVSVWTH